MLGDGYGSGDLAPTVTSQHKKGFGAKMQDADSLEKRKAQEIPPRALAGLIVSIIVLLSATFWTYRVGLEANRLDHELSHLSEHIDEAKANIKKLELQQANEKTPQTEGGAKR